MKNSALIAAVAATALAGCGSTEKLTKPEKVEAHHMKAQASNLPAVLPNDRTYEKFCVDHRARVLAVDSMMPEGWPTQTPVPIGKQGSAHTTACNHVSNLISINDIVTISGTASQYYLSIDRHSSDSEKLVPLTPAPNNTRPCPQPYEKHACPMWYETAELSNGRQYFVYMLDENNSAGDAKNQLYMIEAFLTSESADCKSERPHLVGNANVRLITDNSECPYGEFDENGTGTGHEPGGS